MTPKTVTRHKHGKGFTYKYQTGKTLKDKALIDWIKTLAIPPAWTNVSIDLNKKSKVHAHGRDSSNKKQYIYNARWREKREKKKFFHIIKFAENLPKLRKQLSIDFKNKNLNRKKVLSCMTMLLDEAYFRPGSQIYKKKNGTFGLTTMRAKHIDIDQDLITFEYKGKSGKKQIKKVKSHKLAKVIDELEDLRGYELFKYKDKNNELHSVTRVELNDYIKSLIGESYSAKDFRTWAATYTAAAMLSKLGYDESTNIRKKHIISVTDEVAKILGNTRSVAKSSYIDPRIFDRYNEGRLLSQIAKEIENELSDKEYLSLEEKAVMILLSE